jgi:prepilin-type processing-associated H-X9-DG protein
MTKAGNTFNDNGATGGLHSAVRQLFVCPDAPGPVNFRSLATICEYTCHPRLMPWMQSWNDNPDPISGANLEPYNVAHIKRSSEICLIFDATLISSAENATDNNAVGDAGWNVNDTIPVAQCLDGAALEESNEKGTTHLTDDYGWSGNTGTLLSGNQPYNPGQPVSLRPDHFPPFTSPSFVPNLDKFFDQSNSGSVGGTGNIRFRHIGNTQCNVLMCDGHVQVFNYNARTDTTDMLRKNINVNP